MWFASTMVCNTYDFPRVEDRRNLLHEGYRRLKPDGLRSLDPSHLQSDLHSRREDVKRKIDEPGFSLEREHSGIRLVHENMLEEEHGLTFRNKGEYE
jgi:hypothetical protein